MVSHWCSEDRLEWVANSLVVNFVDPNCWVDDWGSSGDGLHLTFWRRIFFSNFSTPVFKM